MSTITCRECQKDFPKPTTRGRPPVKCEDCRGAKPTPKPKNKVQAKPKDAANKTPAEAPQPVVDVATEEAAEEAAKVRRRRAAYRSGFCGVTMIYGREVPHAPELHAMCKLGNDLCRCKCHEGVDIWKKK